MYTYIYIYRERDIVYVYICIRLSPEDVRSSRKFATRILEMSLPCGSLSVSANEMSTSSQKLATNILRTSLSYGLLRLAPMR